VKDAILQDMLRCLEYKNHSNDADTQAIIVSQRLTTTASLKRPAARVMLYAVREVPVVPLGRRREDGRGSTAEKGRVFHLGVS